MDFLILRIIIAGIIGFLMGILSKQSSATRVFSIICMGAALVTIISTEFFKAIAQPWFSDPGRLSAQIVSALGFIGSGLIWINNDNKIKGIPESASLWLTAIIGILIGAGFTNATVAVLVFILIFWVTEKLLTRIKS